jgi:RNA polymerase sigma-70 factor, ECF subfamily
VVRVSIIGIGGTHFIMRDGLADQIARFYGAHRQELFTYALMLTGCRAMAEDVVHTAFCNLLRRGRVPRELRPYAFRCIRNAALDEIRRRDRRLPAESIFPNGDPATHFERQDELEQALAQLGADEREAITLKLYSGLTFREIAALRRVPLNTAASWYRRGLNKLRTRLQQEDSIHEES